MTDLTTDLSKGAASPGPSLAARPSRIAVIVPCYKVLKHVDALFSSFGSDVHRIYAVDDQCPEETGAYIERHVDDPRVTVIYNPVNLGVGGAVLAGMEQARKDGCTIAVKIDGDGQMDPALITKFTKPIEAGLADFTKGNRFYDPKHLRLMPKGRLLGNAILSFVAKFSTGYWDIFDPTNGYLALDLRLLPFLDADKIEKRYFFETDLLFRAGLIRARVIDIPMVALYGDETSNLHFSKEAGRFMRGHLRNFFKRIGYDYFLRDFSIASLELLIGLACLAFGLIYGVWHMGGDTPASAGVVMLAALPTLTGVLLLLSFINYDVQKTPKTPLGLRLADQDDVAP
ncbi:MAG: glycosyltransferase family 2 protein [Pseudomonadota bacterium]